MKKVDIIRPCSINAIIGPIGTLKRILKNRDYFVGRGYEASLFVDESIRLQRPAELSDAKVATVTKGKPSLKGRIYNQLSLWGKHIYPLACWLMKNKYKATKRLTDFYISQNRTPDIVEFHSDMECYQYLKHRKEHTAKTVMFLHSDGIPFAMYLVYFPCLKNSRFYKNVWKKIEWTVEHVDKIVFIAQKGQDNFLKTFPNVDPAKTTVFLNGIDDLTEEQKKEVEEIRSRDYKYKYRLCCTGTINTRKGHLYIIEALHRLSKEKLAEIHVDFLGEGPQRMELEELVKQYGLENHVKFYGSVPNVEVYRHLAEQNIYILMSQNEGLPISIIEAMRAGLPVISTKIAGIPEIVKDGYNGILLNPSTEELIPVLENFGKYDWKEMGKMSRVRFEKELTFERMMKDFCDMFDSLQ